MLKAHPEAGVIYRSSPIYPHECVWFLAHDFKTLMIESKGVLPAYKEFIFSCDMTSAYEYHKKFLQLLQQDAPGVWNVKKPSHALWLETIFKVYPDARVIWTHRDPFTATGSLMSVISLSHMGHLGKIDADNFAGGAIKLSVADASGAIVRDVGGKLGLGAEAAAFGICEVVDENMANAARVHAVEKIGRASCRERVSSPV